MWRRSRENKRSSKQNINNQQEANMAHRQEESFPEVNRKSRCGETQPISETYFFDGKSKG